MIIMPSLPEKPVKPETFSPTWTLVTPGFMPIPAPDSTLENDENAPDDEPAQEDFSSFPNFYPQTSGNALILTDVPPLIVTNSYDDDDDDKDEDNEDNDDNIEDIPDDEDDDVFDEVEAFEDFDDDFDEDFEDEFDEDYEELARIDDEDIEEEEDSANAPSRYEEEFGDVDSQIKFIPDSGDMPLNEEVLMIEDDLDESDSSDFDDFTDDVDGDDFSEFDNEI